ncbi:MAG: hypothetical protein ACR2NZ_16615 [Rubripirellula sp.]
MSKYYVQCGPIRVLLTASSPDQAAMSALDRTLQLHLWIYDDPGLTEGDCRDHLMLEALCHLDPTVRISERGFDREDATCVGTPETIDRWHRLMIGMNRLFIAAGLAPRSMVAVAARVQVDSELTPRLPR